MLTLNTTVLSYNQNFFFLEYTARIHALLPDKCVPGPKLLMKNISSVCDCKADSQNMNIQPLRKPQQQRLREQDEQNGGARVRRLSDFIFR